MGLKNKEDTPALSLQKQLGSRIKDVVNLFETRKYASTIAGVSDDMLFRYMRGTSKQSFIAVARLCEKAGASMEWVWSGKGEMIPNNQIKEQSATYSSSNSEHDYLQAMQLIEDVLQENNTNLKPCKKVELVKYVAKMIEKESNEKIKSNILQLISIAS